MMRELIGRSVTGQAGARAAQRQRQSAGRLFLLDSGATHRVRGRKPSDRPLRPNSTLQLAVGSVDCETAVGADRIPEVVIEAPAPGEPERHITEIMPLGALIDRGFDLQWRRDGVYLLGPSGQNIPLFMQNSLPYLTEESAAVVQGILLGQNVQGKLSRGGGGNAPTRGGEPWERSAGTAAQEMDRALRRAEAEDLLGMVSS